MGSGRRLGLQRDLYFIFVRPHWQISWLGGGVKMVLSIPYQVLRPKKDYQIIKILYNLMYIFILTQNFLKNIIFYIYIDTHNDVRQQWA